MDGFLDPRTIPPLRCFYLKSIGCFQIGTGSQVCKQLPGAAQAPIKHSRRPIRPAGCLGHQKGRRRCSLPSRLPSPRGLASDSSLKAGELTRRTKLGDSWLTETFALLRLTADWGERMSGGAAQAGGSETPVSARPPPPLRGFGSASRERCEFYGGREMINFALLFKCRRGASPGFHSVAQLLLFKKPRV